MSSILKSCPVCLCDHEEDIHAATLRVHGWFRHRVTDWLDFNPEAPAPFEPETPKPSTAHAG